LKKVKIALIDHNDSFTYNVVEVLRTLGNNKVSVIKYANLIIEDLLFFDKIIFSPGPCLPTDYPKTFEVIRKYYKTKSILGICLGHQVICSFFGAELYNFKEVIHGVNKKILINDNSNLFKDISKETEVGLYHSWAVSKNNFPKELQILANSEEDVIMSVKHQKYNIYGIQFHPESFLTTKGEQMLKNFIEL
jgi:anthranilate synthase/aminodeoxychorismate synthase-like glutamine amidotransferase